MIVWFTADEFLESAHVFDHSYGTSHWAVDSLLKTGVDVILEIDWQGARQVKTHRPDCCSIFILPPSYDELEQRLKRRGEDDDSIVERRMRDAVAEMSHYEDFDFIVVNDDFHTALADIQSIIRANRLRSSVQQVKNRSFIGRSIGKIAIILLNMRGCFKKSHLRKTHGSSYY